MDIIHPIQWFPGHMSKSKRKIHDDLKYVNLLVEIIDARIPISSRSPAFMGSILKPRLMLMNKSDIADPIFTTDWLVFLKKDNIQALAVDCKSGKGLDKFIPKVNELLRKEIAVWQNKGMGGRRIRIMVVGVPNVGKSSFINRMADGKRAKVENRPGVTKENQWFLAKNNIEILDTPGILSPKFEDQKVGENLAFIGSIKDKILDIEIIAKKLLKKLLDLYPNLLKKRFNLKECHLSDETADNFEQKELQIDQIFHLIGQKRGMILPGGKIDTHRTANMLLDEFRNAKLGRITLERSAEASKESE
jgi:ribosome biogenesis GTPase A